MRTVIAKLAVSVKNLLIRRQVTADRGDAVRPACFDSEAQWDKWKKLRIETREKVSFCRDCLPERHKQMVAEGRCESPAVAFVISKDGGIMGLRPDECGWHGAVTGFFSGSRKKAKKQTVAMGSAEAVSKVLRERSEA